MNKEKFLEELRGHLQVLEDQEQQDILDEYAQHIDMKLQKGLSEEEAIRDFGSVKELAAEILEAYHVKPDYQEKHNSGKVAELGRATISEGGKAARSAGSFLRERLSAAGRKIKICFSHVGGRVRLLAGRIGGLFRRKGRKAERMEATVDGNMEQAGITAAEGERKRDWPAAGLYRLKWCCALVCRGCLNFCKWCLRLMWNIFWGCAAGFMGLCALAALFGLGALVILVFQGYPIAGIVILCLGTLLCAGTLSCACFSLLIRKEKQKKETEGQEPGEVQYE